MSSNVGNTPSGIQHPLTGPAAQPDSQAVTEQTLKPLTPAQQADRALEAQQVKRDREEARREQVLGGGQSFAESYGADDDDSRAAAHKIKQGAHKAGVVLSDKSMHNVHLATKDDPATQGLISTLADPTNADTQKLVTQLQNGEPANVRMFQEAFEASPAASLPNSGQDTPAAAGAGETAGQPRAGSANMAAQDGLTAATAHAGAASANARAASPSNLAAQPGSATGSSASSASADAAQPKGIQNGPGHLKGGNWSTYVAMAMFSATKEMQLEKKNELNQIKKYNAMLDGVNKYVSQTLMPAQQDLQTRTAHTKKDADKLETVIYNPIEDLNTTDCGMDPNTGEAIFYTGAASGAAPVAKKVTQQTLTTMIGQADQWRTSISNNQQLHSSNFQSLDTQVTSFMNMITALYKNVSETQTGIARNLT